jgi:phosphoglycerate dehydrogenase-like enzyme
MTTRPCLVAIKAQPVPLADWLTPLSERVEVVVGETPRDLGSALSRASAIFVWGHPHVPFGHYLDRAPGVRWVHSSGAGMELLVVPELVQRRITLTNSRGLYSNAVAEFALAMMLAWAKRLPGRVLAQREHRWAPEPTRGLRGATVVILGLGGIGGALARFCHGLEMHVLGVRRTNRPARYASEVVGMADLARVLPRAEYLAVCCPDTPATRNLIGAHELALLPRGAFLVNVARGSVVDEQAMIEALRSGQLGGAGLDVFAHEPLPATSPLWDLPEVIVSPHFSNVIGFEQATLRLLAENVERFLTHRRLRNVVNARRGY